MYSQYSRAKIFISYSCSTEILNIRSMSYWKYCLGSSARDFLGFDTERILGGKYLYYLDCVTLKVSYMPSGQILNSGFDC